MGIKGKHHEPEAGNALAISLTLSDVSVLGSLKADPHDATGIKLCPVEEQATAIRIRRAMAFQSPLVFHFQFRTICMSIKK